jgi:hypothetical protein
MGESYHKEIADCADVADSDRRGRNSRRYISGTAAEIIVSESDGKINFTHRA